ncbi:MAG: uracil-DNA glycosylase [Dermatophilaceae bacterium]
MPTTPLPHPGIGVTFPSPAPPGTGWPGDPATRHTPRAGDPADVARLAAGAGTFAELDSRISVCRACPRLLAWRESVAVAKRAAYAGEPYWGRPGPGFGDPRPRILVVGLAPAAHGANRTGRMFTGDRSGDWLYAALHRAGLANQPQSRWAGDGLALTGARVVAAVRCAPPGNHPTVAERAACAPWLDRDLSLAGATVGSVLALGALAWDAVLGAARRIGWTVPRPKPRFGHGALCRLGAEQGPVRLVGSYHPSQQNTFTGRLTAAMLDEAVAAL